MKAIRQEGYHELFRIGILVKAADGVIEAITGVLVYFANYTAVNAMLFSAFHEEIAESPHSIVWGYLISEWHHFLLSSHTFWGLLFIIHGTTKVLLSVALLKKLLWAYPTAAIIFTLFVGYEYYSALRHPSAFIWLITILDAMVVILILREYKNVKKAKNA